MKPKIDLTGKRVHKWVVIQFSHVKPPNIQYWWCRCDCGTERAVLAQSLREGVTKSCGCQKGAAISTARKTHGACEHALYSIWQAMRARCRRATHGRYEYYGGRGIAVSERWDDFDQFRRDVEPTWVPGLTLDRIDVNGNYGPDNFRWATMAEQSANRRHTIFVEFDGERIATPTLARRYGLSAALVRSRYQNGKRGHDLIAGGKVNPDADLQSSDRALATR